MITAQTAVALRASSGAGIRTSVTELRTLAVQALGRMFRTDRGLFAFRLRRSAQGLSLEGASKRYTAVVLLALANEEPHVASDILAGCNPQDVCGSLLEDIDRADDLGEVALALWAARALQHSQAGQALRRLQAMKPDENAFPTVELAWSLSALVADGDDVPDEKLARSLAERLLRSFREPSALFAHLPDNAAGSSWRSHVACFADLVYPIQALSHYYRQTGEVKALEAAGRCADRMCLLQGAQGQWWWHYDIRTGRVVEKFPVYAVHQDSMAPMALFALQDVDDSDYISAIRKSLEWLMDPAEISGSLIDRQAGVIWRKVARREPSKLTRSLQAGFSRLHPAMRVPNIDLMFPPGKVDYESRPYHMGWILYTWSGDRVSELIA